MIISKTSSSSFNFFSPKPNHRHNIPQNPWFIQPHYVLSNKPTRLSAFFEQERDKKANNSKESRYIEEEVSGYEVKEEGDRNVHCEVDVISWRERKIKGSVVVEADIDCVWDALTDYERLADFIPNLLCSERIPCPHPGRIWLEQRGLQRALYWHIEARVVLDLQEVPNAENGRELHFSMIDGDFKKYEGKWSMQSGKRPSTTNLTYQVNVIPRFNFPAIFLERIIRSDLPVNLQAVSRRAERNSEIIQKRLISASLGSKRLLSNDSVIYASSEFIPLPPSYNDPISKWGVFGKVCGLGRPCMVDEVHFRRFDALLEDGGVHRCVIASITVKAPVREVWNVLTAYERLPEIVPNLAISKILSRENNKVRILQEGCKGLLYMVLHARVVLDLCETLEEEISFEQVEGDFDSFQGRWRLEQLGSHHTQLKYVVDSKMHKDSFLSEAIVEEVIYEDLPSNLGAIRDFVENLEAAKSLEKVYSIEYLKGNNTPTNDTDESRHITVQSHGPDSNHVNGIPTKPRVPGLQRDLDILKSELLKFISQYGQEGFMPMRKQLRAHGRVDIEKAINRKGGFGKIASLLNLSLSYKHRKPKGYWDNLENMEKEISRFQRSWGMDPAFMPSRKSFERAGRYDIARALEKWGGLHEVARLLSFKVRHPSRQPNSNRDKKVENVRTSSRDELEGDHEKNPYNNNEPCVSQDNQKWLNNLKHLDINWVE